MEITAENDIISTEKTDRRATLRVFIGFLVLAATLAAVLLPVYQIKNNAAIQLFENLTFTRISAEARQHIRKIEFNLANGKDLEQFHGISSILRDIGRSSSYVEGVYIVGKGDVLLYSHDQPTAGNTPLQRQHDLAFTDNNDYAILIGDNYFDLLMPIIEADEWNEAYVIIRMDKDVVSFPISGLVTTEMRQTIIIGLQMLGLGLIILTLKKPKTNGIIAIVLIFALLALTMDMALSYIRFREIAESTVIQSANRIAQMLQSDIGSLTARGISADQIFDVNSWLHRSVRGIEMIHSVSMDPNMRISLTASLEHINEYSFRLLMNYAYVMAGFLIAAAVTIMARVLYLRGRIMEMDIRIDEEDVELEIRS